MGQVYRARDERLARDVAIKLLAAHSTDSIRARERFRREAQAVAALQHPNICTIYDVGETADGRVFIVMELLQGETLQQRIAHGPLDERVILEIGAALADGLQAAHAAGIVHRDIKPANILLTSHGPKILDFGRRRSRPSPAAWRRDARDPSAPDRRRQHCRHIGLHVARATARRRGRRANGPLLVRVGAVRNGDRPSGVYGKQCRRWCRDSA